MITAVILAGGKGARLRNVLPDRPKPMAPVAGRPFIEWVIRYLAGQGIARFVLSTGHLGGIVEAHFSRAIGSLQISCVREQEPLGTAGGFLNCAASTNPRPSWWLVCNGDSLAVADLSGLVRFASAGQDIDGGLLGVEVADRGRYGSLTVSDSGALQGFAEKRPGPEPPPAKPGRGIVNAGLYLLHDEFVRSLGRVRPLSFERDVFPAALRDGARLPVIVTKGAFLDIGTPESLSQASDFAATSLRHLIPADDTP